MADLTHAYGWLPSLPDPKAIPADTSGLLAKNEVDPRDIMQDPYDQGQLGSCTANAYAGAAEYDDKLDGGSLGTPSRLAIYYGERKREGTLSYDSGAFGHDAFKDGREFGVASEKLWPYDIQRFASAPPQSYVDAQGDHKILKYVHPAPNVDRFKRILSNDQTIAFGFTVYESFESYQVAESGKVPMPGSREKVLGGHEVLIIGYLASEPEYALVRNSWGTGWGLSGYFLMPWAYITDPSLSSDWRSIHRSA